MIPYPEERPYHVQDELARELGCEETGSLNYVAHTDWDLTYHHCFSFTSRLTIKAGEVYRSVRHYLLDGECKRGMCLCVAKPRKSTGMVVVHTHEVGRCPLSEYFN